MSILRQQPLAEGHMELRLVAQDQGVYQVTCAGPIVFPDFCPGHHDPFVQLLGPDVYAQRVLLSLEQAEYLDSSGVTWFLSCHRSFQAAGGVLVLHSIPHLVRYILQMLHIERFLFVAPDLEAAQRLAWEKQS